MTSTVVLIFLSFIILIGLFWIYSSHKSLNEITQALINLARGSYGARVRRFRLKHHNRLGSSVNLLAEKIQAAIAELTHQKAQVSTILSSMVEAVVAVDEKGHILTLNPKLRKLFSLDSSAKLEGRPLVEVLRHISLNQLIDDVLVDGSPRVTEVRTFLPDEHVFEAHVGPLIEDGRPKGVLLVLHDITPIRKLEEMRKEFVANVSHELKTPLSSIRGYAETLRMGAIEDKKNRMEFLSSIETQADQMTRLVDDLLSLAAIESGRKPMKKETIALEEILDEVVIQLKPLAERKKVWIQVEKSGTIPRIKADRFQIRQVFTNLIDNAIKFNREEGTITVQLDSKRLEVSVVVKDTGLGIPSDQVARVFERFFRVDKARSREMGGTGLGLAIVKHIIEAHGGSVSLESKEGQGSTFTVRLPII